MATQENPFEVLEREEAAPEVSQPADIITEGDRAAGLAKKGAVGATASPGGVAWVAPVRRAAAAQGGLAHAPWLLARPWRRARGDVGGMAGVGSAPALAADGASAAAAATRPLAPTLPPLLPLLCSPKHHPPLGVLVSITHVA